MEGTPETPAPGDPLAVSDTHVEALLQQAESLVGEIAQTAGVEPKRKKTVNAAGEFGAIEPDAVAAVELTVTDAAQVAAVMEAAEVAEAAPPAESLPPDQREQINPPAELRQEEATAAGAPTEAAPFIEDEAARLEPASSDENPKGGGDGGAVDDASPQSVDADASDATIPSAETRPGLPRRLLAAIRQAPRAAVRFVLGSVSRVLGEVVILLDRPFAHLPAETKQRLGLIGLGTLLMGASGFLLPRLMQHNPYLELDPPPAVSGESDAGEHGGKQKPAKAESKHAQPGSPAGKKPTTGEGGHGAKSH